MYNLEFAEMLGLSNVGVTTHISSSGRKDRHGGFSLSSLMQRGKGGRRGSIKTDPNDLRAQGIFSTKGKNSSEAHLNEDLESAGTGESSLGAFDWSTGITKTTYIETDK
jgi:hypothetical protein